MKLLLLIIIDINGVIDIIAIVEAFTIVAANGFIILLWLLLIILILFILLLAPILSEIRKIRFIIYMNYSNICYFRSALRIGMTDVYFVRLRGRQGVEDKDLIYYAKFYFL